MNEPEEPRRGNRTAWIVSVALVVVFVLYPLSIGPVAVIAVRTGTVAQLQPIYAPLNLLPAPCKNALSNYVTWWLEITGTFVYRP